VIIATVFIVVVIAISSLSRFARSTELRVANLSFHDADSAELWPQCVGKRVHLVPMRTNNAKARKKKLADVRKYYAIKGPVAFINVQLLDNRSDFLSELRLNVKKDDENFIIDVTGATPNSHPKRRVSFLCLG
jgi:hypothetical protein